MALVPFSCEVLSDHILDTETHSSFDKTLSRKAFSTRVAPKPETD